MSTAAPGPESTAHVSVDTHVVDAAVAAAQDPKNHRYTPATGLPELKQAIADKTARVSGVTVRSSPAATRTTW
ncbi:MAG: aminotransferase class I/II-fold pyridoxal phosphate-dependent enzyme [Microbacterium sp.]|nr:aminotransferase class I/II-fold pyridoxal phosphate-dependent enzyme [Microbacterium sp.]